MKKLIVLCLSAAALASLSACSTTPASDDPKPAYSTPPPITDPASAHIINIAP